MSQKKIIVVVKQNKKIMGKFLVNLGIKIQALWKKFVSGYNKCIDKLKIK